jgi:hypothetical protein
MLRNAMPKRLTAAFCLYEGPKVAEARSGKGKLLVNVCNHAARPNEKVRAEAARLSRSARQPTTSRRIRTLVNLLS